MASACDSSSREASAGEISQEKYVKTHGDASGFEFMFRMVEPVCGSECDGGA
jgi:hypothetical protein